MAADGSVIIDTRINTKGFGQGVANMKQQFAGLGSAVKKLGIIIGTVFAVKKIAEFGKESIELGSDLEEVQNVVDSVFTTMSDKVDNFAKNAAKSAGLSETMAKRYAGTFGAMSKSFGFAEKDAYEMSTALTQLAGDVASFYNISQDEAYTKLKSVFTGETETLKELGVVMTQNALDSYAMANGYGKTTSAMTEQEKVALRYRFVMDQLSTASGDFLRTSDGWANQVRVLKLQIDSLKSTIGQGLINIFTPVIKVINTLLAKLATVANAFKAFTELITGKKSSGSAKTSPAGTIDPALENVGDAYNNAADGAENLAGATKDVADSTKEAEKAQKKYLSGLDEIRKFETDDVYSPIPGGISGSSAPVANAVENVDYGNLAEGKTVLDEIDGKFEKLYKTIKDGIQPTIDSLKRLWNEGLSRLGDFTWTALKDFYDGFLVPVGKWALGTGIPRFVDTLNNGLMKVNFNAINNGLKRLWDALSPFTIKIGEGLLWFWENALVPLGTWTANEVVPRFLETLSISIDTVNRVLDALQPLFSWFWDNVLNPIAKWTGGIFLKIWDGINGALQAFSDWCADHPKIIENMTIIIGSFFAAFMIAGLATKIMGIVNSLASFVGAIQTLQTVMGAGSVAGMLLGKVIGGLTSPFGIAVVAIGSLIAAGVLLWKNWDEIKAKAKEIWGKISTQLNRTWEIIKRNAQQFGEGVKNVVAKAWNMAKTATTTAWNAISDLLGKAWNGLKTTASTVFSGIGNAVSGAWKSAKSITSSAWNSISQTVSGVMEKMSEKISSVGKTIQNAFGGAFKAVANILRSPINSIIGLINGLIRGVVSGINIVLSAFNKLKVNIPSWVPGIGGKSLGFNFGKLTAPQIPYLASGAVIPPNAPFMAVLGDQRHGTNIEAPLSTIEGAVENVFKRYNKPSAGGNYQFTAQLNRRTIFDEIITEAKLRQSSSGRNPFELA